MKSKVVVIAASFLLLILIAAMILVRRPVAPAPQATHTAVEGNRVYDAGPYLFEYPKDWTLTDHNFKQGGYLDFDPPGEGPNPYDSSTGEGSNPNDDVIVSVLTTEMYQKELQTLRNESALKNIQAVSIDGHDGSSFDNLDGESSQKQYDITIDATSVLELSSPRGPIDTFLTYLKFK